MVYGVPDYELADMRMRFDVMENRRVNSGLDIEDRAVVVAMFLSGTPRSTVEIARTALMGSAECSGALRWLKRRGRVVQAVGKRPGCKAVSLWSLPP